MKVSGRKVMLAGAVVAACGGAKGSDATPHAVGTYVGGGSVIVGPDPCTYSAGSGVLAGDGDKGPKFVLAPGAITTKCGESTTTTTAVVPTGATITGPTKIKAGATSGYIDAKLTADGKPLDGEAALDWQLGKDCEGHATFAPVMGAQDTGGPDRFRKLVTTSPGTCTVSASLTTGSALYEAFKPQTFKAEQKITIE